MLSAEEIEKLQSEDPYWFEELFQRDLKGWFSGDIACCDECYGDFLSYWPHAYNADNAAFQCNSISLDCFYDGSRLQDYYSKEDFFKYLKTIPCPRCGDELKHNIWAYDLPFDIVDNVETKISEVADIAAKTPFLILEHYFARETFEAIKELSKETKLSRIDINLYRARTIASLKNHEINEFDFPPKEVVSEGRYNHAGNPVLYLASDPETCFAEMRESASIIAEIEVSHSLKVLDLINPFDTHEKHSNLLNTLIYSALLSAKQYDTGSYKPMYTFSRFIADCAKHTGFDAIKYPSTRNADGNYNIVIINDKFSLTNESRLISLISYAKDGIEELGACCSDSPFRGTRWEL